MSQFFVIYSFFFFFFFKHKTAYEMRISDWSSDVCSSDLNNLQLHDAGAYERSSKILLDAMVQNPDFMEFAFPARIAPPLLTRYTPGMNYGLHPDAAYIPLPDGQLRTDVRCTVFLNDPADYDGGALHVELGSADQIGRAHV